MAAQPFAPVSNVGNETRDSHSLEYIAFYLGEIEKQLGKIAGHLDNIGANSARSVLEMQGLAHVLGSLDRKA
jgi:hypothetical protein